MPGLSSNPGGDGDLGSTVELPPADADDPVHPETLDSLRATANDFAGIKPPDLPLYQVQVYHPRGALLVTGAPPIVAPPFDNVPTVRRPPLPPPAFDSSRITNFMAPPAISARPTVDQNPVVATRVIVPEEFPPPEEETFVVFETDPIPPDWTSCRIVTTDGKNTSLRLANSEGLARYGLRQITFPDNAILPIERLAQNNPDMVVRNIRIVVARILSRRPDVCAIFTSPPKKRLKPLPK